MLTYVIGGADIILYVKDGLRRLCLPPYQTIRGDGRYRGVRGK